MTDVRHFLEIDNLSTEELVEVLDRSESTDLAPCLDRKSVALLFEKPSTRTRHSCEAAIAQLGGNSVYTRPEEVGIDTRETAEDIARTLSGYHAAIAARVFRHNVLDRMATVSSVPVINLLSDDSHPVQTLADLLTIRQSLGEVKGKTIAFIGDANNVAFSLAIGAHMMGARFLLSYPPGYGFSEQAQKELFMRPVSIEELSDPSEAARQADVIYTDTWISMGQEDDADRRRNEFVGFQVNDELMSHAHKDAIFMHCLPAHRNEEVTDSVLDGDQSRIWTQATNRMNTMRGLFSLLVE